MKKHKSFLQPNKFNLLFRILCFFILISGLNAETLSFNHLLEKDGLASRRCYSIIQDRKGFIWIANKYGVDRFDGKQIKHYPLCLDNADRREIKANQILQSKNGKIWGYDSNNIYYFNSNADKFEFVCKSSTIQTIFILNEDSLIVSNTTGLYLLDVKSRQLFKYKGLPDWHFQAVAQSNDRMYIGTSKGLIVCKLDNLNVINQTLYLAGQSIRSLYVDSDRVWIGLYNDGLFLLKGGAHTLLLKRVDGIPNVPVRKVISHDSKRILAGTDGAGVYWVNRETLEASQLVSKEHPEYENINTVRDVLVDNQKNIWIASYHKGISYIDNLKFPFREIINKKGDQNSLSDNFVNNLIEDSRGNLWFGTHNGLNSWNRNSNIWKHYFYKEDAILNTGITALCEDNYGNLWFGGYMFGAARMNLTTGNIKRFKAEDSNPVIQTNDVFNVSINNGYKILFFAGGLSLYDPTTNKTKFFSRQTLNAIKQLSTGKILVGMRNGLFLFDENKDKLIPTPIKSFVNTIYCEDENTCWVGTSKGLIHYSLLKGIIKQITLKDGLLSEEINSITTDSKRNLWLGTENGLVCYNPVTGLISTYNKPNGLPNDIWVRHAAVRCRSGELVFGGVDGAVIFNPDDIPKETPSYSLPLVFTQFSLNNNPVNPADKRSPLTKTIDETTEIKLNADQNYFTFEFTAPNYQKADKTNFSYQLKGYDVGWSKVSENGIATYSKLPPGRYYFAVRLFVDSKQISERNISILISPPWWNSIWAWYVYIIILGLLIYYAIRYVRERQAQELTRTKMEIFINTAHDILSPLNLIEAPLKDLHRDEKNLTKEQSQYVQLALNNTKKLNFYIKQLLDFQKISLNSVRLTVAENDLLEYLRFQVGAYRLIAEQKGVHLNLQLPQIESKKVSFDKEKISRILDNLLSNALKYTLTGGTVTVKAEILENEWILSVKDNGMGIPKRIQYQIFKQTVRGDNAVNSGIVGNGIGLKLVYAFVKLHQGTISFNSIEGIGTEFILSFPLILNVKTQQIESVTEQTQEAPIIQPGPDHELPTIRILIAEDEQDMADYLVSALSKHFQVKVFPDGKSALENVLKFQPDLLISDVQMPVMDGFAFCEEVKKNPKMAHIPFIMLTGVSDQDAILKGHTLGISDYILKPFDSQVLIMKILNLYQYGQTVQKKHIEEIKIETSTKLENQHDQEFMENVLRIIEQNIDNPNFNVVSLCSSIGISRTIVYTKISQLTGFSPIEFIRVVKLKKAANLLLSGNYTVAEASLAVGFENTRYFSRIFKEHFGVVPKNYVSK